VEFGSRSASTAARPWDAERQAVEFGVEIGEYRGVVRVSRRVFQRLLPERPTPSGALKPITYSEPVSRASLSASCPAAVTEDGDVEISGRDLREVRRADMAELRANSRCRPQKRRLGLGADADGSFPGSEAAAGFRALRFAAIARVRRL